MPPVRSQFDETRMVIARARAALARPLPAPRCDRPVGREMRRFHAETFVLTHDARGGRWS